MSVMICIAILLPLIWSGWRGRPPHFLMWQLTASVTIVGLGAIAYTTLRIELARTSSPPTHDQIFVVPDLSWTLGTAVLAVLLGAVLWAGQKWATPLWPQVQKAAVWLFAITGLTPLIVMAIGDMNIVDQNGSSDHLKTMIRMLDIATLGMLAAMVLLVALPVLSLLFHRSRGPS